MKLLSRIALISVGISVYSISVAEAVFQGLEANQSIQDLSNDVPLMAGKPTVVRVYVGSLPSKCRATLGLQTPSGVRNVPSLNEVDVASSELPLRERRSVSSGSFNFLLPPDVLGVGTIYAQTFALSDSNGQSVPCSSFVARQLKFSTSVPLRVALIGIRYRVPGGALVEPRDVDYERTAEWLEEAYPVSGVIVKRRVIDFPRMWPFIAADVNAFLQRLRRDDALTGPDRATHYYGIVADNNGQCFMRGEAADIPRVPDPTVVASGPAGDPAGTGWEFDKDETYGDWYAGHELGHTFGRYHLGFPPDQQHNDDPDLQPYDNGYIAPDDDSFVGLWLNSAANPVKIEPLPGRTYAEMMTYLANPWVSDKTYEALYNRILLENMPSQAGPPLRGQFLSIHAKVNKTKMKVLEATTDAVDVNDSVPSPVVPGDVVAIFSYVIGNGEATEVARVRVPNPSDVRPGEDVIAVAEATIRVNPLATQLKIRLEQVPPSAQGANTTSTGDEPPAETALQGNAYTIQLSGPAGGKVFVSNVRTELSGDSLLVIHWKGTSTLGVTPRYVVQASLDGGVKWITLGMDVTKEMLTLGKQDSETYKSALFRVFARGGSKKSDSMSVRSVD